MPTQAVQHIRRMRGGAQSHLMRCADSNYYVVKFQNNPQPVVDQYSRVLRVVLELDDVVIAVGAAHEMALRTTAHPADVLNGLGWHERCPYQLGVR